MMFGPPYTVVRVETPVHWNWIGALPTLISIDLAPPASGPEIELTFATSAGVEPAPEDYIVSQVASMTHRTVLASKRLGRL